METTKLLLGHLSRCEYVCEAVQFQSAAIFPPFSKCNLQCGVREISNAGSDFFWGKFTHAVVRRCV